MKLKCVFLISFFFFFWIIANSLAQKEVMEVLINFSGVVFLIVFLLILLGVAGAFPKIKPGNLMPLIGFILLLVLCFLIPQFVPYPKFISVPESFKRTPLPPLVSNFLLMLGLPQEWMFIPGIIYLFILPFAGIYTLIWAFLSSLNIFVQLPQISKVNRLLAFIITFLTIPIGWFVKMVWVLFAFMGAWSIAVFTVTFVLGIFFRGYGVFTGEYYKVLGKRWLDEAKKHLESALADIRNRRAGDAVNHLEAAKRLQGFHSDYYDKIGQAINFLSQTPVDWTGAEDRVKEAKQLLT